MDKINSCRPCISDRSKYVGDVGGAAIFFSDEYDRKQINANAAQAQDVHHQLKAQQHAK